MNAPHWRQLGLPWSGRNIRFAGPRPRTYSFENALDFKPCTSMGACSGPKFRKVVMQVFASFVPVVWIQIVHNLFELFVAVVTAVISTLHMPVMLSISLVFPLKFTQPSAVPQHSCSLPKQSNPPRQQWPRLSVLGRRRSSLPPRLVVRLFPCFLQWRLATWTRSWWRSTATRLSPCRTWRPWAQWCRPRSGRWCRSANGTPRRASRPPSVGAECPCRPAGCSTSSRTTMSACSTS